MTATAHSERPEVVEATDAQLRRAVKKAQKQSGYTYDELAAQARTGRFKSMRARMAWMGCSAKPGSQAQFFAE